VFTICTLYSREKKSFSILIGGNSMQSDVVQF
jgi:hypothetical protein